MEVNREKMLEALNFVRPGLASKEILEQSTCFVFDEGYAFTYNDEIAIRHPIEGELQGAVQAKPFYSLLEKLKDETVVISVGGGELNVKSKKATGGIKMEAEISLPVGEIALPKKWLKLPEDFIDALGFCIFSASRDMTKPYLTCLHVQDDFIESSDNIRLTRRTMKGKVARSFLIPAAAAKELIQYTPTKYATKKGWAHFKMENGTIFSCRVIDADYPDTAPHLEVEGSRIKFPTAMTELLDRAGVFSETEFNQDEYVTITLDGESGSLILRGDGPSGWYEEKARVRYKYDTKKFMVNPSLLRDMLSHLNEVVIGERALLFDGDNFSHIVCLVAG